MENGPGSFDSAETITNVREPGSGVGTSNRARPFSTPIGASLPGRQAAGAGAGAGSVG